jgi:hypothetical protein
VLRSLYQGKSKIRLWICGQIKRPFRQKKLTKQESVPSYKPSANGKIVSNTKTLMEKTITKEKA